MSFYIQKIIDFKHEYKYSNERLQVVIGDFDSSNKNRKYHIKN
ncbi:hypothetical protein [Clostridium beijerinckii]|nr:hypothetical protein [Clostridium beijerinckii]NRT69276.1 thiamine pyrophosphokinase [Clostridium beijerinckii]NRU48864.1 thiamine pyrophosphokinase [Clostridium beijerinckii]